MAMAEIDFLTLICLVSALYHSLRIAIHLELRRRQKLEVYQELQKTKSPIISYGKGKDKWGSSTKKRCICIEITRDLDMQEQMWKPLKIPTKQKILAKNNIPLSRCHGSPSLLHPIFCHFLHWEANSIRGNKLLEASNGKKFPVT